MHELQVHTEMTVSEVKALIEASTLGDVPAEEQHLFNPECVHTLATLPLHTPLRTLHSLHDTSLLLLCCLHTLRARCTRASLCPCVLVSRPCSLARTLAGTTQSSSSRAPPPAPSAKSRPTPR